MFTGGSGGSRSVGAIDGIGETVGDGDGADVGFAVGLAEGVILGSGDGRDVGDAVGFGEGNGDGAPVVGTLEGCAVVGIDVVGSELGCGDTDGCEVVGWGDGGVVGTGVGVKEGLADGDAVGSAVGSTEGSGRGTAVGTEVGSG